MSRKRIVIIGGVAGGASCAARARRLSETADITVVERSPHVSFANCGLPYHIGGEIKERQKLLLRTPEKLEALLNIKVMVQTEAVLINRERKSVQVRNVVSRESTELPYDVLVLSTGAAPMRPRIPGIDQPGIYTLRNMVDMDAINGWIDKTGARRAVVVGGGYIGIEMAEQLHHRGLSVAVAEALPQIMGPFDPEMAAILQEEMEKQGVVIHTGDGVDRFDPPLGDAKSAVVVLKSGTRLPADLVILGMGVKPDIQIARDAGLDIGKLGGIRVDEHLLTSDPAIHAIGDAIEVRDAVLGEWSLVPLAGPANRMGRIVADNIFGKGSRYTGTWGTAGIRLFGLVGACTGANEKRLRKAGVPFEALHLHPSSHAGYYPGAKPIALKLLFSKEDGRVLGAQAVGEDGVEKRIDVIATALIGGMTIQQLAQLELSYAPPFGSAKDPVNLAGMAAENIFEGLVETAQWHDVARLDPAVTVILDVRDKAEVDRGAIPGSLHIPLDQLRGRLGEIPKGKEVLVHCQSGQRSYSAARILSQNGFKVRNLSGSYKTWSTAQKVKSPPPV